MIFFNLFSKNFNKKPNFIKFLYLIFSFLIYLFVVILIVSFIIKPLDNYLVSHLKEESILKVLNTNKTIKYSIIVIAFIGPIFEELIYRLALVFNKINISILISVLIYKLSGGKINSFDFSIHYLNIIYSVITFCFLYYFINFKGLIVVLKKYQNVIIILSILLFGLGHITNIKHFHWHLALFYPVYVLPQVCLGYFLTNLRIKFGFIWGVLLHIMVNSLYVLMKI